MKSDRLPTSGIRYTDLHRLIIETSALMVVFFPILSQVSGKLTDQTRITVFSAVLPFVLAGIFSTFDLVLVRSPEDAIGVLQHALPIVSFGSGWVAVAFALAVLSGVVGASQNLSIVLIIVLVIFLVIIALQAAVLLYKFVGAIVRRRRPRDLNLPYSTK